MQAIKGIYEHGIIKLREKPCLRENQEVTILILGEEEAKASTILQFAGMLADLTPEEEAAFDESLERTVHFQRVIEP